MRDLFKLFRSSNPQSRALHFSYEKAGLTVENQPIPWNADAVIVTGINTIPCLRQIAELLAAVRPSRSNTSPVAVVLNRYQPTMTGGVARRKHVGSVLRDEKVFYVRDDASAMAESINTGVPIALSATFRKTAREIGAIAAFCAELKSVRTGSAQIQVLPGRIRAK